MNPFAVQREDHLVEREEGIATARVELRAEREQIARDRAEADLQLADARAAHREATRFRERARRLARRFARRLRNRHNLATQQLEERAAALAAEKERLAADVARFESARTAFRLAAAAERDRLKETWTAVKAQQLRANTDWIETQRFLAEETENLEARAADLAQREKECADARARAEAETAGFREEARALEARIENARVSLADLERRRDLARAELLGADLPAELEADWAGDGDAIAARETPGVLAAKAAVECKAVEANDVRRVAAEQLVMLAEARALWQRAEQATIAEMECLARELGDRELEVDARERWLIRADRRRREESNDLWRLRLHLESWQTKLTAHEMRWHTEREQLEADYGRRVSALTRRETELETTILTWERARTAERERLRAEFELWSDDRARLSTATAALDQDRSETQAELGRLAGRALAAEEMMAWVLRETGKIRDGRRIAALRRWWEWRFGRLAREVDHRRAEASAERATLDNRYRALHDLLLQVAEREAAFNHRQATRLDLNGMAIAELTGPSAPNSPKPEAIELEALRAEVERLATLFVDMELPELTDPPEEHIPWALDASTEPAAEVLAFDPGSRAA